MENKKLGRPKSDKPIRDKTITLRLTEEEQKKVQETCYKHRLAYVDVLLKGLEFWSNKK